MNLTHDRFHYLEKLTLPRFRSLSRELTAVLQPVGMVEVHGEHLPLGTDNYGATGLATAAAAWLLDKDPTIHVLMLPLIPYGIDPVDNRRPDLFQDAGSLFISRETLKAILRDVLSKMAEYGFRYLFPTGFHGGIQQSIAMQEVCEEIGQAFPGTRVFEPVGHVLGGAETSVRPGVGTLLGRPLTTEEQVALNGSIHASMFETSMMLHLRPELVDQIYKGLRTIEWRNALKDPDWPGYVGAGPAHANADVGGAVLRWRGVRAGSMMYRVMMGEDLRDLPRHPTWLPDKVAANTLEPSSKEPFVDPDPEMVIKPADLTGVTSDDQPDFMKDTIPSSLLDTDTLNKPTGSDPSKDKTQD